MSLDTHPPTAETDFEFPAYTPHSTFERPQPGVQIPGDASILEMLANYRYSRRDDNQAIIDLQSD